MACLVFSTWADFIIDALDDIVIRLSRFYGGTCELLLQPGRGLDQLSLGHAVVQARDCAESKIFAIFQFFLITLLGPLIV